MGLNKKDIVFPDVPHDGLLGGEFYDTRGNRILAGLADTTWASLWDDTRIGWRHIVDEYEANPGDFYAAWHYLDHHPAFWGFRHGSADPELYPLEQRLHMKHLLGEDGIRRCMTIMVKKVNAETRSTEDGPPLETEVWIELGKQWWPKEVDPEDPETFDTVSHDYLLDYGGPTVEAAILRAAYNVWRAYGNDRRVCDAPYNEMAYVTVVDDENFEEMMREHGDDGAVNKGIVRAARLFGEIFVEATGDTDPQRKKKKAT